MTSGVREGLGECSETAGYWRVKPTSDRWRAISTSEFDHEKAALAYLCAHIPDREPFQVFTNFEFVARTGQISEVDALIIADSGVWMTEIKSHPHGSIGGDPGTWQWQPGDGRPQRTFDNPLILTDRKSKRLVDLLRNAPAMRGKRVPRIDPIVFLSSPDLEITLTERARKAVFGQDARYSAHASPNGGRLGGIIDFLTTVPRDRDGRPRRRVDTATAKALVKAMGQIGIRPNRASRQVGDYRLGDLLDDYDRTFEDGVSHQDYLATHVSIPGQRRRIRIYPLELQGDPAAQDQARRAARREFELIKGLRHPGIGAPVDFTDHERGPALFYDHDERSVRLDHHLASPAFATVGVGARLDLVRAIAEAVGFAHGKGVFHRALAPRSIWVTPRDDAGSRPDRAPEVHVTDWQTGTRIPASGTAGTSLTAGTTGGLAAGTRHLTEVSPVHADLYRAPEGVHATRPSPRALDIFSIGAIAFHTFAGRWAAPTRTELDRMLAEHGGLPIEAVADGVDDAVRDLVFEATQADANDRLPTVEDLLAGLELVLDQLTAPDDPGETVDPLVAEPGDVLAEGRFTVTRRLGRGSTAQALEVTDGHHDGRVAVLKVAIDPDEGHRLDAEAQVLDQLDHRLIVRLLDGPFDIGNHRALLLSSAGTQTLAARLRGGDGVELIERFGENLLEAVDHLEQQGVSHRDLKPDNLGVAKLGPSDRLALILFDFSLARAPIDQLGAGTSGYIDPFLRTTERGTWDLHAERYAAAVTLWELLTRELPIWGDGSVDPTSDGVTVAVDANRFDPAVADGLVGFFTRAFARDIAERFDTATDMLRTWRQAFGPLHAPIAPAVPITAGASAANGHTERGAVGPDDSAAVLDTDSITAADQPLAGVAMSALARDAIDGLGLSTVGELADLEGVDFLAGLGARTRRELAAAVETVRVRLAELEADDDEGSVARSVDAIARKLVPAANRSRPIDRAVRATLTGLATEVGAEQGHLPLEGATTDGTATDGTATDGTNEAERREAEARARVAWAKLTPLNQVRAQIAEHLRTVGAATGEQLAAMLLATRGSVAEEPTRSRQATALVRAAIEVEAARQNPRWVTRRLDAERVLLADEQGTTDDADDPSLAGPVDGEATADHAVALGRRADELVADDPIVGPTIAQTELDSQARPPGSVLAAGPNLVALAAAVSAAAAASARHELYRRGLPPAEAIAASRRVLTQARYLTPAKLAERIHGRFPSAADLPDNPSELGRLLRAAGVELVWDPDESRFARPVPRDSASATGTTFARHATGALTSVEPAALDTALSFSDRLVRAHDSGGLLVLAAPSTKRLAAAERELADPGRVPPVTVVDLDAAIVGHIRAQTASGRPKWDLVVDTDAAGPTGKGWPNLERLADRVFGPRDGDENGLLVDQLLAIDGTVLAIRGGLLARYGRLSVVDRLRDGLHDRAGALRALWLLTVADDHYGGPMIDGEPVPVIGPGEWARVPDDWLANADRASRPRAGTPIGASR